MIIGNSVGPERFEFRARFNEMKEILRERNDKRHEYYSIGTTSAGGTWTKHRNASGCCGSFCASQLVTE